MNWSRSERRALLWFFGIIIAYDCVIWAWNSHPPPRAAPLVKLSPVNPEKFQKVQKPREPDEWWVPGRDGHPGHYELPSEKPPRGETREVVKIGEPGGDETPRPGTDVLRSP